MAADNGDDLDQHGFSVLDVVVERAATAPPHVGACVVAAEEEVTDDECIDLPCDAEEEDPVSLVKLALSRFLTRH